MTTTLDPGDLDDLYDQPSAPPAGNADRFGGRWRLVGAGLFQVWRYGLLTLPAPSGRLLLRGPNGTGKTTALEALWPYLLDLNAQRLSAGTARRTNLSSLMKEGADGKRRVGFAWLSFAAPDEQAVHSYGVRLAYSPNTSPQVKVVPFTVPGIPFDTFAIPTTTTLSPDEFASLVEDGGGRVFPSDDAYINDLARAVWGVEGAAVRDLAQQIRQVRNPSLLGEISPQGAADALRQSLPGVGDEIVKATADALEESEETRRAFDRDREAARHLAEFANDWAAYVGDTVRGRLHTAREARALHARTQSQVAGKLRELRKAQDTANQAEERLQYIDAQILELGATIEGYKGSDEYRDAGELREMRERRVGLVSQAQQAATDLVRLTRTVHDDGEYVAEAAEALQSEFASLLAGVAEHLGDVETSPVVTATKAPRAVIQIGEDSYDPGPDVRVAIDQQALDAARARCEQTAQEQRRRARAASLALGDHESSVAPSQRRLRTAVEKRQRAETEAEDRRTLRASATAAANEARDGAREAFVAWSTPEEAAALLSDAVDTERDDLLVELDSTDEPSGVLAALETWSASVAATAATAAATLRAEAQGLDVQARTLRSEATGLRDAAQSLRDGQLLPFPRPAWAGDGDDDRAFGAALDWRDDAPAAVRDRVEAALASMGALAASLSADGAATDSWAVTATGEPAARSLAQVITVDADHPGAATAAAVLERIPLLDRLADAGDRALAVAVDGSWRAGVLTADPVGPGQAPASQFIGSRQRRERALQEAARLDEQAAALDEQAQDHEADARGIRARAARVETLSSRFPDLRGLRAAEAERSQAAKAANVSQAKLEEAEADERDAQTDLDTATTTWASRTRGQDLPADVDRLRSIESRGERGARALEGAARELRDRIGGSAARLGRRVSSLAGHVEALPGSVQRLRDDQSELAGLDATIAAREEAAAKSSVDVIKLLEEAQTTHKLFRDSRPGQAQEVTEARETQARVEEQLRSLQIAQEEQGPVATQRVEELRLLLRGPGVADALTLPAFDETPDDELLDLVESRIGGRTLTRSSIVTRFDAVRSALSGVWSLDFGEEHLDLTTFVATHEDTRYAPPEAAARAEDLRKRAEEALTAAETTALNDFVIGRLPTEIGTAFTTVTDWVDVVNRKMREASASSGVGVQVRSVVRDDLDATQRTVYQLAAKISDAVRSPEQRVEVGQALRRLIDSAPGETMVERVAAAVNIRDWLDVTYQVQRPGRAPERWTGRTGLSGGERRLVVLAPMLAALAATFDNFDSRSLRLAALDEVPAEVDELGREGLARYIASLDLDLICTSYLWDGAPGAWDGVDAHDLEAASDGMVVAFPMLVRGEDDLPGDEAYL